MDNQSHTIIRLAVHLPLEQPVYFKPGSEEEALLKADISDSTLLAWFKLNQIDNKAHEYLYHNIPNHYTFYNKKWSPRKRDGKKVIGRMYLCSPNEGDRFYLRLLLLHVKAACSFQDLLSFEGIVYTTFKEAANARALLEDDREWERSLNEAVIIKMPKILRNLFASICVWSHPTDPLSLFNKVKQHLYEDFLHTHLNEEVASNLCLIELQKYFRIHGKRCSNFGLPEPENFEYDNYDLIFDEVAEINSADILYKTLNINQVFVVDSILNKVNNFNPSNKNVFFIDGPGIINLFSIN